MQPRCFSVVQVLEVGKVKSQNLESDDKQNPLRNAIISDDGSKP